MVLSSPEAKKISNQPVETPIEAGHGTFASTENGENEGHVASTASLTPLERKARLKIDIRLCSIAGVLCCLNLLDSGILSSASVTTMQQDLNLQGSHYSESIFLFTIANVVFNLPCTVYVRLVGPRLWFAASTFCFGIITLSTAFIHTWGQMIALRVLLGISMAGIYPGVTYMISVWYTRREQQVRFALMQSGEVVGLATGNIVNYALNHLDGRAGLAGWRWMFLVQGLIACAVGILTYWWMVDFPEFAHRSFLFLSEKETQAVTHRIQLDRGDVVAEKFSWAKVLRCFKDVKVYGFACMFFLLNIVSTSLNYFLPIILQSGMGFSSNAAIILSTPVRILNFFHSHPDSRDVANINYKALLLGRHPGALHLLYRRHLSHPRTPDCLQRSLSRRRIPHAGSPIPGCNTLCRYFPCHRCLRVQLGCPQHLHGE